MAYNPAPIQQMIQDSEGRTPQVWLRWFKALDSVVITGTITLDANQASTTFTDPHITPSSIVTLTPTTANAALEVGNGSLYISSVTDGAFTVTHANNAQTDRSFNYGGFS